MDARRISIRTMKAQEAAGESLAALHARLDALAAILAEVHARTEDLAAAKAPAPPKKEK